jgi:NAD(P)-dependent dehydrogenase (short-subunit alcohol dehydrogenase family)
LRSGAPPKQDLAASHGQRDDVAAMALFLCSPAARNLSGQVISVDGNLEYV